MQIRRSQEQSECEGGAETRTRCVHRSARFFSVSEERDYICLTSSVWKMVQSPWGGQNAVARCWRACTPHGASGLQSCLAKAEFLGAPCNGASTTLRVGVGLRGQAWGENMREGWPRHQDTRRTPTSLSSQCQGCAGAVPAMPPVPSGALLDCLLSRLKHLRVSPQQHSRTAPPALLTYRGISEMNYMKLGRSQHL